MSLFSSLHSSAGALMVFQQALTVSQNNVANSSTAGYAKQTQTLDALRFDPSAGVVGGVGAGIVESSRDKYAEAAVQRESSAQGKWQEAADSLSSLESSFDISGESGIASALTDLFGAFSAWSVAPNDGDSRQQVLSEAELVAEAFNQAADTLSQASAEADQQLRGYVDQVNSLAARICEYNTQRRSGKSNDAGIDAAMYSALEELSQIANITTLEQADGSMTVMLGGQTPLVVGEFQYEIAFTTAVPDPTTATYPSGPPNAQVLDSAGQDITSQVTGGQLGGLLYVRNDVLAGLRGDSTQAGSLNTLAKGFADRVNALLTSGNIDDTPTAGVALFSYGTTNDTTVADTLSFSGISTAELAAIDPGPPYSSNGTALKLAKLASPTDDADKLNGQSFTEYFGNITATIGRAVSAATDNATIHSDILAQAKEQRESVAGVSLDEEAVRVLEFQRAYQAAAKMVTVLDSLTETVVNMIS